MSQNNYPQSNAPGMVAYYALTEEQLSSLASRVAVLVAENAKSTPVVLPPSAPMWISRKAAAEKLGVSLPTIHALLKKGALTFQKVGSRTLINESEMMAKLASGQLGKYKRMK